MVVVARRCNLLLLGQRQALLCIFRLPICTGDDDRLQERPFARARLDSWRRCAGHRGTRRIREPGIAVSWLSPSLLFLALLLLRA